MSAQLRDVYSRSDRAAYWSYVRLCCAAGVSPLSVKHWLLLTEKDIDFDTKRTHDRYNPVQISVSDDQEHNRPWAKRARIHRADSEDLAGIGELNREGARRGWVIGELGKDGLVHPESRRSQEGDKGGEAKMVARLCRSCRLYLLAHRFSKNGKPSGRTICKFCDATKHIRSRMQARELKNPIDRDYAVRTEKAASMRRLNIRTQALLNFCPTCREYRSDNHPQPCGAALDTRALAQAAD